MLIPNDKWLHFVISALLTIGFSFWLSWIAAVIITFAIGLLKELYDKITKGNFSIEDIYADLGGIMAGTLIFAVIGTLIGL